MHPLRICSLIALALGVALELPAAELSPKAAPPALKGNVFPGHPVPERDNPLPPAEAARSFTVPPDLEMELLLAEPIIAQPVFLNFDERGRMWVVEYRQYPAPAGLTVVSKDQFWRALYDKVPEPPPRGVRGRDRISIHEDTDGNGSFDKHSVFVDGLNIATACVRGRGGVWVLNPPYLLFYPDANNDDIPDADPVVHLTGFGLEDTHSVVNSLRWGPDGWLYAAQGSTVTANVRVVAPGSPDTNRVFFSQGQNIWRYHPTQLRYEVFSEGGGNAFGVEFDPQGRVFSGHNGGDTRGFHYMQGAYLRKGFEKHGELSNPYAFGYFPHMEGTKGERFTHNFILYHGGAFPPRYTGKLFGIEPLQGRVVLSDITPTGSTFATRDLERVVTSSDPWFRPVDIKTGPDGAIYIADWYDRQVTHTRNQEGNIDASNGRIYRLKSRKESDFKPFGLAIRPTGQLVEIALGHSNGWFRQEALRLLYNRRDPYVVSALTNRLFTFSPSSSLPALWALYACGGFDAVTAPRLLSHADPQVRLWAARLFDDYQSVLLSLRARMERPHPGSRPRDQVDVLETRRRLLASAATSSIPSLTWLASTETNVEVRAQLASTAQRLPAADALPILAQLLTRDEDAADPRLPLLCWWAIESKCATNRDAVVKLFEDSTLWPRPLVEQHILSRLMRRFAAAGTRADLLTCAKLLDLSPDRAHSLKLMTGFEEAFKGRSLAGLPAELTTAMLRHGVGSEAFRVRQGTPEAIEAALKIIADPQAKRDQRLQFIEILGETKQPASIPVLLGVATDDADTSLRKAALTALLPYTEARIATEIVARYRDFPEAVRPAAQTLLASRAASSLELVQAVDAGRIAPAAVPLEVVRQMQRHALPALAALLRQHWPQTGRPTTADMERQIQRLAGVVRAGPGDPYAGKKLFTAACASCHRLYQQGGHIGPDLTLYHRADLDTLLLHIVNPSAEIREGYENFQVETKDDRSLTGFLVTRDPKLVVLRGLDGQNITLDPANILELKAAGLSLMPEGLLDALSEQQVRDLFAYLRGTQPLAN